MAVFFLILIDGLSIVRFRSNSKSFRKGKCLTKNKRSRSAKVHTKYFFFFSFESHSHHGGGRLLPPDPAEEPDLLLRPAAQPDGGGGAGGGQGAPGAIAWREKRQNPAQCTGCSKGGYSGGSQRGK